MSIRQDSSLWKLLRGGTSPFLIAGPCVIESEALCHRIAQRLVRVCERLDIPLIFKASYDKANRSSATSFRGPGLEAGLAILDRIKTRHNVAILTDVHSEKEATAAGEVVDIIQIPAFLSRQSDLLQAAAKTKRIINVKKGQFAAPKEMENVIKKLTSFGCRRVLLTERGTTFGYHNLVADMRSIPIMQSLGCPVVFDATHSVQLPGGAGDTSGGQGQYAPLLARAAIAAGANGVFIETHPNPKEALSDGPNMIPLKSLPKVLEKLIAIKQAIA